MRIPMLLFRAVLFCIASGGGIAAAGAAAPRSPEGFDSAASALAAARAGRADPAAVLDRTEAYWSAHPIAPGPMLELGLELVEAAHALRQPGKVVELGERLRAAPLDAAQRKRLLVALCANIWTTRDPARIRALEAEVSALAAQSPGDPGTVADLWRNLAACYHKINAADDAVRLARRALATVPSHPHLVEYKASQVLAVAYIRQGKLPEAIEAMRTAEQVGKALGLPDDPALLLNFSGMYLYTRNWRKVIEYGQKALQALDAGTQPSRGERERALSNIGVGYAELGQLERAEAVYTEAIREAHTHGRPAATPLNNLADMLQKHGAAARALPMFREAADEYARLGDKTSEAVALSNVGATLVDLGQPQAASGAFARSLALFVQADDVERRLELYPRMIGNLRTLGRYREALALMDDFKRASDEHVTVESNTRIARLESVVDLERKKGELAEAERARATQQGELAALGERERWQRAMMYGMSAALLVVAVLALLALRQSRARSRLNLALAQKNAEIQDQHRSLAELNAAIRRQSEEDALTGLHNRRYGQAYLERLVGDQAQALRQGRVAEPALLMLLDIDHFKRINDTHGHLAGDQALKHFAEVLRGCGRPQDALVRWGGEEFLWICPGLPASAAAGLFARLRERLDHAPLALGATSKRMTVSMGFGSCPPWPQAAGDWPLCLRIVDAALYRAKAGGRDGCVGLLVGTDPGQAPSQELTVEAMQALGWLRESAGSGQARAPHAIA